MKFRSAALIAFTIALAAVSPRAAQASRVVITAPDPTCGEGAVNPFFGDTISIDGTVTQNAMFTYCGTAPLPELILDVTPTLPNDNIFCLINPIGAAFNECATSTNSTPPPPGLTILTLMCDPDGPFPCSGDLVQGNGVGVAFSTPEPTEAALLLLGLGVSFIGLGGRRGWKRIGTNSVSRRLTAS
jgi:hypothetical protein